MYAKPIPLIAASMIALLPCGSLFIAAEYAFAPTASIVPDRSIPGYDQNIPGEIV